MYTINRVVIRADLDTVFRMASEVERWPTLLPHYRWVTVTRDGEGRTITEMAARRDFIPVWWRSYQEVDPARRLITYHHIGGVTTGMDVEWWVKGVDGCVEATILHWWNPSWPLPSFLRRPLAYLAGELFIKVVADRTLLHIKRQAESTSLASRSQLVS